MKNIIRLIKYARPYWWLLVIAGFSLLTITALNLVTPWLVKELIRILTEQQDMNAMLVIQNTVMILVAAYVVRAVFTYFYRYLSHVAAWKLVADMRTMVYEHLQKLSLRYYHDKQTGQLMSRTINDTATFEVLIAHAVPDLITNGLILIGITTILFVINAYLAALALIPIPFLMIGGWWFTKKVLPNFREAQSTLAELNAVVQDNISGIKEIQVFNQQIREKNRVDKRAKKYASAILHALKLSAIFHPAVEMVSAFGTVVVVGFGGWLAMRHYISPADIVGFILYLSLFYQPITTLARVIEDLQQATAGAERVFELLDTEPDIVDQKNAKEIAKAGGEITFEHVDFEYVSSKPVLKDVSFHVQSGQMLALVGPTGVGKTTIISLAARFYDPTSGRILLDGTDIKEITISSLRNQISIVLQDIFLFNGSVADNIAYGSKEASLEDIVQAAKIARAHDFISELPQGYDTIIGERGVKLSGGQKQRLSIARAVLRNTPILILDEATAAVDVETEKQIQQAIQELAGSKTIIVIAHRLSTVKKADRILVLKEGEIVESGTHEDLLQLGGLYEQLCKTQLEIHK
ncbi:ABC transporter ATP-binding protein [Petroclostridium sp. X23]|uniref:ABC transporter ATP-binding protein n=1 Tax=Petroclostridium sp. X23 TaxID=3045146 RepID=UPI0024ADC660|nr:ABC transporter ATP-binding protein [Petroclostridium sp. X23]WHH60176.1 ABC transporter ATP-binding protein [Petroclostridium sp. X23]